MYAGLSGIVLYFCYQILYRFRCLIRHSVLAVNIEDLLYWLGVSIYLFRQMYRATYGEIRWFFVLGVAVGAAAAYKMTRFLGKIKMKYTKYLEKEKKTR